MSKHSQPSPEPTAPFTDAADYLLGSTQALHFMITENWSNARIVLNIDSYVWFMIDEFDRVDLAMQLAEYAAELMPQDEDES